MNTKQAKQRFGIIGNTPQLERAIDVALQVAPTDISVLKQILDKEKNDLLSKYDNIFIDCPPSLSLLTIMALVASEELLVPLQTEFFALEGITQLVKTIDRIKVNLNPDLKVRGILLTMFDKRNKLSSQVDKQARNYFKEKV